MVKFLEDIGSHPSSTSSVAIKQWKDTRRRNSSIQRPHGPGISIVLCFFFTTMCHTKSNIYFEEMDFSLHCFIFRSITRDEPVTLQIWIENAKT